MKIAIFALEILLIAVAIEAYGWGGGCKSQDDCEKDECCMGFSPYFGSCKKRLAKDNSCVPNLKLSGKFYFGRCPCQVDLECSMEGSADFPGGEYMKDPRCRQPAKEPVTEPSEEPVPEPSEALV